MTEVWIPNTVRMLAEQIGEGLRVSDPASIERFWQEGFGIKPSPAQVEARVALGQPGPRLPGDPKFTWLSGGQRAGKTVELFVWHAEACLYKVGVDNTNRQFWSNFAYKTLHCAPTDALSLKMWAPASEISKGASEAQWDAVNKRSRKGIFLDQLTVGNEGIHGIIRFRNGAKCDFRSTEGKAKRLEGEAWWFITWDEWASQYDGEIEFVRTQVLQGRSRDFDAKIVPAAWPKPETERHLIAVIRKIESGADRDSKVVYLPADQAHFTNQAALETERRTKSPAEWMRTVLGQPAGGASVEFPTDVVNNMIRRDLRWPVMPDDETLEGYHFFSSWDLGLAHDSTVGLTWAIPAAGVSPMAKARVVNAQEIIASEGNTLDTIEYAIAREQALYRSQSAIDATGLGGVMASRGLRKLNPPPLRFVARSNDRFHGNIRLAAITRGLDCLTWGRPPEEVDQLLPGIPWGLIECPAIPQLIDQMANFDRDAKSDVPDDWVWSFLIGCWYIARYYVVAAGSYRAVSFDVRNIEPTVRERRRVIDMRTN